MKAWKALLPLGLALLLVSCDGEDEGNPLVPCLHPLFAEHDSEFDPALVGAWTEKTGEVTFAFAKSGDTAYKLTVTEREGEKEESAVFEAHLVRLGASVFLDFYPEAPKIGDDFYKLHLMRAHTMATVLLTGDELSLRFLASGWLKKRLDDKSVQIDYEKTDDSIVLTALTADLQDLAYRYANDEEAFSDTLELHRVEEATQPD